MGSGLEEACATYTFPTQLPSTVAAAEALEAAEAAAAVAEAAA